MKSLFVTYDGLTDSLGQSQILPYYKGLSSKGHQITIISFEKENAFKKYGKRIAEDCKSAGIDWQYQFYTKNPPVLSTFFDLRKMEKLAIDLHLKKQFDIVHCRTVLTTSVGLQLQKRGAKFVFDIRGFWADERVDGKLWNLNNPLYKYIYKLFKKKEKKAYGTADHIITLTKAAKGVLIDKFAVNEARIDVIPCTVDLNHFNLTDEIVEEGVKLKRELQLEGNSPVLGYVGSLGTRYLIIEMLEFFKQTLSSYPKAKFLIVTHSETNKLEEVARRLGISNQIVIASTTYQEIPKYITIVDLALYFIYPGNSGDAVSPTKQAEFLSFGIPIITNAGIGDSKRIIEQNAAGVVIEVLNEKGYESAINQIPSLLNKPKAEIINIAKENFNLEMGVLTYHKVYLNLNS